MVQEEYEAGCRRFEVGSLSRRGRQRLYFRLQTSGFSCRFAG